MSHRRRPCRLSLCLILALGALGPAACHNEGAPYPLDDVSAADPDLTRPDRGLDGPQADSGLDGQSDAMGRLDRPLPPHGDQASPYPDRPPPQDGPTPDRPQNDVAPPPLCDPPAQRADVSHPSAVVGTGSPETCTEAALDQALAQGGIIVFACGGPHTLTVTAPKAITQDTVIEGGGVITLSGGGTTRILAVPSSFERDTPALTVQGLTFREGSSAGQGGDDTDRGGGAIHRRGGRLTIIDCDFYDNHGPATGQDVAGGAVYTVGGGATIIVDSLFQGNSASNGGALGVLHSDLHIASSDLMDNEAQGSGGNPGNGGNGGAIYIDGVGQDVTMCGVRLSQNRGNAYGGGLFRVSNDGTGRHVIDRCLIEENTIPDQSPSKAGGLYLQGMAITISNSTIAHNQATSDGGLFAGPNATLEMVNTTVAHNVALSSLAGGMSISGGVTGRIINCTFANNRAPGELAFAAATVGGGEVIMQNTIVSGHEAGNGWNPISCRDALLEGGGNIQYPVERSGGGSDDPGSLCTPNTLVADPRLGPLEDNGGPTPTLAPAADGPAHNLGQGCPPTDQRGEARGETCTSGAVEVR